MMKKLYTLLFANGMEAKLTCRNSTMNALIQRELRIIDVHTSLEPNNLIPTSQLRPDGMSTIPWKCGKPIVWDYTCVHPLATSHLATTHGDPGKSAALAEEKKRTKYKLFENQYIFTPIAVETLGGYGPSASSFFTSVGKMQRDKFGWHDAPIFLHQRLSIELQRSNAKCVMWSL